MHSIAFVSAYPFPPAPCSPVPLSRSQLIRVCSDHGDAVSALAVYDWMVSAQEQGGAGLEATPYTYTAAMRAALAGGLTERALGIWNEAWRRHTAGRLALDCRLCITYLELCTRLGLTDQVG